jgi:hypothetical protein
MTPAMKSSRPTPTITPTAILAVWPVDIVALELDCEVDVDMAAVGVEVDGACFDDVVFDTASVNNDRSLSCHVTTT